MGVSLEITGLARRFNGRPIFAGLDLRLDAGEAAALLGPSGCGKSTLLRLIAGLDEPEAGTIRISDSDASAPGRLIPPWQRRTGMLFQGDALWPHLRVGEQVRRVAATASQPVPEERLREIAGMLGIGTLWERYPGDLSGGEARRVALLRTLAGAPDLLLLDEPFAHLDEELQRRVVEVIRAWHADTRSTLLLVSHESPLIADWPGRHVRFPDLRLTD